MDWSTEALMALRVLIAVALGVLVSLIVFGLLSLHHAPGWLRLKAHRSDPARRKTSIRPAIRKGELLWRMTIRTA